jgi:hypothetical protein
MPENSEEGRTLPKESVARAMVNRSVATIVADATQRQERLTSKEAVKT